MALATNTLDTIRIDIRRLTRSPSESQVSTDEIDQYINTFIAYDFPEHLRVFDLHTTLTFYLSPNIDTYPLTQLFAGDPLYNFKNAYVNIQQPIYIAGYNSLYTQDPQEFFMQYPDVLTIASIGVTGNGTTPTFTGNLNNIGSTGGANTPVTKTPILPSTVTIPVNTFGQAVGNEITGQPNKYNWGRFQFSTVDAYNNVLTMIDAPIPGPFDAPGGTFSAPQYGITSPLPMPAGLTTNGNWGILFNPQIGPVDGVGDSTWDTTSFINYLTGQYSVTFSDIFGNATAPGPNATINSQSYPYVPSRPQLMMYYDDMFVFRPVPDQAYPVSLKAYARPTQLIAADQIPDIEQWWQYISLGAAIKLLQRRLDMDTVALLMPIFMEQQALVLRKTIVQNTTQRSSTIYVQTNGMFGYGNGWIYNGF